MMVVGSYDYANFILFSSNKEEGIVERKTREWAIGELIENCCQNKITKELSFTSTFFYRKKIFTFF